MRERAPDRAKKKSDLLCSFTSGVETGLNPVLNQSTGPAIGVPARLYRRTSAAEVILLPGLPADLVEDPQHLFDVLLGLRGVDLKTECQREEGQCGSLAAQVLRSALRAVPAPEVKMRRKCRN